MYQNRHHLLFLHGPVSADALRQLIPNELEIDTYNGDAYVGIVPFTMDSIRFRGFPSARFFRGAFQETNVRKYVRMPRHHAVPIAVLV